MTKEGLSQENSPRGGRDGLGLPAVLGFLEHQALRRILEVLQIPVGAI